ncbi:SERTA domain-containing protein 2-like [Scleropages formosus]|uniref:SERTA domain-containing protein 2-like n=1 Tax=Scleropages formosus TaxID=113540 RepID=A0A0N8JWK6_SCLFO|nr:SERTA domain-containing protein 2-like [Scleropages formosus]
MAQRVVTPYPATVPPTVSDAITCVRGGSCDLQEYCTDENRYMLGKGAKRKHEENEDELEGAAPAPASGEPADGPSKASYTLQRQTIFNMSLMKLYSQRAPADASLERRVLINNMLRRIQDELKQEGALRPLLLPASSPPEDPADEGFREAQPAFAVPAAPDSCLTPASLLEDDTSLFCTSPPPHGPPRPAPQAAKDSFSSALDEIEELCPATATTSPSDGTPSAPLSTEAQSKDKNGSQRPGGSASPAEERTSTADPAPPNGLDMSPSAPPSSSPSSSSGFLTDLALDDILFADIDTSMYDFDPCTSGAGAGPPKVAPVVTADDLVKTLSPYSGGSPSSGPSQPFKMDLAELDHIMEVLVGS